MLIFLCIAGVSIPSFFFASSYIEYFAVKARLNIGSGNTGLVRYLPAAVCIAIGCIALFSPLCWRITSKRDGAGQRFYARCRGLSEGKILLRYALPSAVVTLLPTFCQMLGLCMAGSAIVERVFSLPGLGYLIIDSVLYRDSPVIHATILFLAFSLVMFNILSDILRRILQRDASCERGGQTMSRTKHILSYAIPIVILLFFLFGSFFAPHDPTATNIRDKYLPSSAEYPFGTDDFGRCEFSRSLKEGKQL